MSLTRTSTDGESAPLARRPASRGRNALTGTLALIRLILRRDRIRIPVWIGGVVAFLALSAVSVPEVYPTEADLQARGDFVQSPVLTIFSGPGYGADDYTVGAMVANEYLIYGVVAVALMSILMVIRHTRAEEETGRAELVSASVVGHRAAPTAALIVAVATNLLIGAATALALTASLAELSSVGSWVFGLSMASAGIVLAALAAVTAQVTQHARGATGIAVTVLAVFFVLRAAGDMGDDRTLSWVSPIGWVQSTRAYVDERWWPLLLPLVLSLLLTAVAYGLASRRDVTAGLVAPRPGPPGASRTLATSGGMALRLQWSSLAAWGAGLLMFGAVLGSLVGEVETFLDENPQLQDFFGAEEGTALVGAFLSTVMLLLALLTTGYAVAAALRLRTEETAGRAEPLLATAVTRGRWARGHLAVVMGGGAAVLVGVAVCVGVVAAIEHGQSSWVTDILGLGLAHVPAMWLIVGVVVALYGLLPRVASLGWAALVYAAVVGLMGDAFDMPEGARVLSPFHHVPGLPLDEISLTPLVALTVAGAVLVVIGLAGLQRRDINVT